jgi:hypothetical protein
VQRRVHKLVALPSLVCVLIFLASCGSSGVGTIPSGTPDRGNGTPAVIPTPSPSPQTVLTAPSTAPGNFYAFVRDNQLWVAQNGANPIQVTHFDYTNLPNVFWHQPLWSPGDHFIAFIVNALPAGLGGGGCPGPDYGANGALYLLNTGTMQLTRLVVPADNGDALASSPHNGYWQYIFWEDSTHLLAWYNGITGKTSDTAGLYRYDLNSSTLSQVIPLSGLGIETLFNVQKGLPLLLSIRYSSGQLFYQVIVHAFGQQSQVIIYRHSVVHPEMPSSKVLEMGTEPWCNLPQSGPYIKPGWDVSPDGGQLVAQMIIDGSPASGVASISVLNLNDGSTTALFAQVSPQVLSHDLVLTWGPDSQTVVAAQYHMLSQNGPYSATLANPAAMQQYTPNLAGQAAWRADGSAFVLQSLDTTGASDLYLFVIGNTQGQLLLKDVRDFVWG